MPVPIVTTVSPATGPAFGRELVEILGNNFRLPTVPANVNPVPVPEPTVAVTFDGVNAISVEVVTEGRLLVVTPPGSETANAAGDRVAIPVVVTNLDDNGVAIPGESTTNALAYTYELPRLYQSTNLQSVVDLFIQVLKDQVHPNVILSVDTDWDGTLDGLGIANIAEFPAIVLDGPTMRVNRFYSKNALTEETAIDGSEEFRVKREPRTVDIAFGMLLMSNSTQEILNLAQAMTDFFHRNKFFAIPCDLANPVINENTEYEMDLQGNGDFSWSTEPNNSNLRQMRGSMIIRGVDIVDGPIIGKGAALGAKNGEMDVILESQTQLPETDSQGTVITVPISGAPIRSPPDA